jgi:hypothetical protein
MISMWFAQRLWSVIFNVQLHTSNLRLRASDNELFRAAAAMLQSQQSESPSQAAASVEAGDTAGRHGVTSKNKPSSRKLRVVLAVASFMEIGGGRTARGKGGSRNGRARTSKNLSFLTSLVRRLPEFCTVTAIYKCK